MTMQRLSFFAAFCLLFLAACGGGDGTQPDATTTPDTPATTDAPAATDDAVPAFDGPAFEITMTPVGNEMRYEQTEFTVQPGQTVRITFENTATSPAMHHNVVVLRQDANVNEVGQAALTAAGTDYIPDSEQDQIIAHTAMAAPGETVTVEFTAPAAGDYTYVCTYPGHYMTMQGTMHVVAS